MEFEELKKIWDTQNNQPMYAISEQALHNRIASKKNKGHHITNFTEWLLIMVNAGMGSLILALNFYKQTAGIFFNIMAAWMFCCALYVWISRIHRIKGDRRFDRSMQGDLEHAISTATYQVRISYIMRWNILPIGIFVVLGTWEGGKLLWIIVPVVIFFVLVHFASGWEHNIYKSRRRELEMLRNKLIGQ